MNELEKIAYAKTFIDKLANGINPLDDTQVSDEDIINHVRVSRCLFYVSELLQNDIDRLSKERTQKYKERRKRKPPFFITLEQLQDFEYSREPISVTILTKKINWVVRKDIEENKMKKLSYRLILQWLLNIGMIEYREWRDGEMKRFPTEEGLDIGLVLGGMEKYDDYAPVIYYSEKAQRFIIDNIDAVLATKIKKGKTSFPWGVNDIQGDNLK